MARFIDELPDLYSELDHLLAQVPRGRVTTYGALAEALGNRIAARWVGHHLLHHDHGPTCRCHRVVRVDGRPGAFVAGSSDDKAARLAAEGIERSGGCVDVERYGFDAFRGSRPLARLRALQDELPSRTLLAPLRPPRLVAGVDVSYPRPGVGVAAYVLLDLATGETLWQCTHQAEVRFPYISSYLAFRELPLLLGVVDQARAAAQLVELLLVDGSGIMHPRQAGIATHLGIVADVPTIGVTKKLLVGQVDLHGIEPGESRPVFHDGQRLGCAIRVGRSRKPIYVSPGQRVDVPSAESVVRHTLMGHRLPEPIYQADRLSRAAGRARERATASFRPIRHGRNRIEPSTPIPEY